MLGEELLSEEKNRYVTAIKGEEVRGDDSIEYFFPTGVRSTFAVSKRVMAVEVPQDEEVSARRKNGERKEVGSAIRRKRANRGSINNKKLKRGVVVWRDVDPSVIRVEVKRRKRGCRKFRK